VWEDGGVLTNPRRCFLSFPFNFFSFRFAYSQWRDDSLATLWVKFKHGIAAGRRRATTKKMRIDDEPIGIGRRDY
jgi:hypothetical protein